MDVLGLIIEYHKDNEQKGPGSTGLMHIQMYTQGMKDEMRRPMMLIVSANKIEYIQN